MASSKRPNFQQQQEFIEEFLKNFKSKNRSKKYMKMLQEVVNRERVTINIELDDFAKYDKGSEVIADIEQNTKRYMAILSNAIDNVMPQRDPSASASDDTIDVLADWRLRMQRDLVDPTALNEKNSAIPKELLRRYEIAFICRSKMGAL